jgi:orotidine-5'-phosphate decarboxylase
LPPSPSRAATDRIIFPLDFDSLKQAAPYIKALRRHVGLFKIGMPLFFHEGREIVSKVRRLAGRKVLLDLKLHDIPRAVKHAATMLRDLSDDVCFLTVHTCDGEAIVRAAVEGAGPRMAVLGVTVVTSVGDPAIRQAGESRTVADRVAGLAHLAKLAGCRGVICSGHEVDAVKRLCGERFLVVTPGIRPCWAAVEADDQRRAMTPSEAIAEGADYVVVGRPIYGDHDPVAAANRVAQEIEETLRRR